MTQGAVGDRQAAGPPERSRTRELGMERLHDECETPQPSIPPRSGPRSRRSQAERSSSEDGAAVQTHIQTYIQTHT